MLKLAGFLFVKYAKPALTHEQQADLLLGRGLVAERQALIERLRSVGYYRLCAYWHPFKRPDESFVPGTTLAAVWDRYTFDRQLRLAVMDAIERVEVAVRSALIDTLALRHGPFVHLDIKNFPGVNRKAHEQFLIRLREDAERSSEDFVTHFKVTYDEYPDLPVWVVAEIMTFGTMLTLFRMSERRVQKALANRFGIRAPVLSSWLLTLNYVRNVCAHHARLWNRELAIPPMIPDERNDPRWHGATPVSNKRVYVVLTQLQYLLGRISPASRWRERLFALFDRSANVPLALMGIPPDWRAHVLWT